MISLSDLQTRLNAAVYADSFVTAGATTLALARTAAGKRLLVTAPAGSATLGQFAGEPLELGAGQPMLLCPLTLENARTLRASLPNLQPVPLGLATSAGFGDRLGLATPGHVAAVRTAGGQIAPIFAQQSIREMARTHRQPEDVLADATWGAFEAGWRLPVGADADHLKTTEDIDRCAAAGFTFFTFDPGQYVDSDPASAPGLEAKVAALPWVTLESSSADWHNRYAGRVVDCDGFGVALDAAAATRTAVKYGGAIAHVVTLYRHLASKGGAFEVEISVDETETPTTPAEHVIIASELKRLNVDWVSLAPRFVGRFEKGVEYIGDLEALRADLNGHAAIARALGPYKLSLHSGSDKFSVYPLLASATQGQLHLKTAGTSYLEALRALGRAQPALFRRILALAFDRYAVDRATYHVSAEAARVPEPATLSEADLPGLLDNFDARQILHVTFGSVLAQFEAELKAALRAHEAEHYAALETHFARHLTPFKEVAHAR